VLGCSRDRGRSSARFVGNPHVVRPSRKDYALSLPNVHPTFPEPLPAYLSRNAKLAPTSQPPPQPQSANAGRFSLSLKGMRRALRTSGPYTEQLVGEIENAVMVWLCEGDGAQSLPSAAELDFPGIIVGTLDTIHQVSKTPLQLVWAIDDAWTRYVVHCCARYHEIVSFSEYWLSYLRESTSDLSLRQGSLWTARYIHTASQCDTA
jgi:hypothetical protein